MDANHADFESLVLTSMALLRLVAPIYMNHAHINMESIVYKTINSQPQRWMYEMKI